jgi:hypothetical protein
MNSVAVVGNHAWGATANGGGIYFDQGAGGLIYNSVITGNSTVNLNSAGGIALADSTPPVANVTVSSTIIGLNYTGNGANNQLKDAAGGRNRPFTTGGNNRLTSAAAGFTNNANGDHISSGVTEIVTGIADTYNHGDDGSVLSIRDAVDFAGAGGVIWLPAWKFTLTRQRTTAANLPEPNVSEGDIEIGTSMTIHGTGPAGTTKVAWKPGVVDAIFDLLGDYDGDGVTSPDNGSVDANDYVIWRSTLGSMTDLRADGNDNGVVDQGDYDIWRGHFGNTLVLDLDGTS